MVHKKKILLIGDASEAEALGFLSQSFEVLTIASPEDACHKISSINPKLVIYSLDGQRKLQGLKSVKRQYPDLLILALAEKSSITDAVQALKEGAFNYLSKPVDRDDLMETIDRAFQAHEMVTNVAYLAPVLQGEDEKFSSQSGEMHKIYQLIGKVASVNTPVLLRGESGTGKEVMAKAIHCNSLRKEGKFVAINCSAIPETLIESELFGHEKGAFTGAIARKLGKFQYAHGGTLFLDEIGDISLAMQVKLLRVLQDKKFMPVGSNVEVTSDVRIIAATNRNLEDMMDKNTFRDDLFYRLSVLPIFLPPLRDRREDIESLVTHFIRKFNESHGNKIIQGIDREALSILRDYAWPGNIRELRNVIEHAFVLETGKVITPRSLPEKLVTVIPSTFDGILDDEVAVDHRGDPDMDFRKEKERFEKDFIVRALKKFKGKINQTSLQTHIPKKTLLRKIEKYKINTSEFKD